jgi:uncharacterized lipoprotein YmbA
MLKKFPLFRVLFTGVAAAVICGCGTSPPARIYTLDPIGQQEPGQVVSRGGTAVSVSITPVELPDYLDRSQIVTRQGIHGLKVAEFDRWGGSLSQSITTVLVENLSSLLSSNRVFATPWPGPERADYRVAIRILRLDCIPAKQVVLKAQWLILKGPEKHEMASGLSTFTEGVSGEGYETLVDSIAHTVGQLGQEIARKITTEQRAGLPPSSPAKVRSTRLP